LSQSPQTGISNISLPINQTDLYDLTSLKQRIAEKTNASSSTASVKRDFQNKLISFAPKQSQESISHLVSQTKHIISQSFVPNSGKTPLKLSHDKSTTLDDNYSLQNDSLYESNIKK
jgi:hypothetical protein